MSAQLCGDGYVATTAFAISAGSNDMIPLRRMWPRRPSVPRYRNATNAVARSYRALRSRRTVSRSKPASLELAHDHADVLLAEVLSPVPGNRDHDAGFVAEAPVARSLPGEFAKAVID
jgi:hypothetical protein